MPIVRGWKGSQIGLEYHPHDVAHRPTVHLLPLITLWLPAPLVAPILLPHPTVLWVGRRLLRRCCALHRLSCRRNSAIPTHLQIHVERKEKATCCNATNFYGYGVVKARTYFPNAWMEAFDMEWTPEFSSLRVPDRIVKSL